MHTNALINESSPYLLQHAHNPVNWLPWNESAFEQAKRENKLVLISIGYSACHWCHVMEYESFEDETVASIMNEHFINIKVDREERPDVDMLYMSAVQLMSGQGGWPLNCFVLPDGRPIYGGTYFQKPQWISILNNLSALFRNDKSKVLQYASDLTNGIQQAELIHAKKSEDAVLNYSVIEKSIANWKKRFDTLLGGPNHAPKFPLPNNYSFLLKYAYLKKDAEVMKQVDLTLQKMAIGGIYDQLGGGFARYSVDMQWKVPHFEKMLYDNAQLVTLYCEAYRFTKNKLYKETAINTIEFVLKEWLSPQYGFYSALDADSEGEEGKYYVWQKEELANLLGEHFYIFCDYYSVNEIGYWEHDNYILMRADNLSDVLVKYNITEDKLNNIIAECKQICLKQREKRVKPGLDNKILTAWNALMCKALCEAYLTFNKPKYKEIAIQNAEFISENLIKTDNSILRSFSNGEVKINGFLDDYAFTIDAFISIYTITQNEKWLNKAHMLCEYTIKHFYSDNTNLFYYTSSLGEQLVVRTSEVSDNVIPASNSQMAINLYALSKILQKAEYHKLCVQMIENLNEEIMHYGAGYSNWASLYMDLLNDKAEVCIVGKDVNEKILALYNYYLPNTIFVVSASASELELLDNHFVEGKTLIYVCKNKTCKLPTEQTEEAVKQIEETV